jgi:LuxR family maltose regulon positive regulatory protein
VTADPHDAGPPSSALGQLLLDGKYSVPQPRPGTVSRHDLVDLARSSDCRLVAITAPAGYGKSTFLVEWAHAEDRRVAWVSLNRFDDDPAMLLTALASAYWRADLASADLIADMQGPGLSVLGRGAPRLVASFSATPAPFVLMLDDLHELQSPTCHDVLGMVISGMPEGCQLATASRSEQPHLPRLRASRMALELGPGDLALDATGARQIFATAQVNLDPEQATTVTERTEGWPVGLYLAAVVARESHDQAPTVTGDDRYIADYLYREALIQWPEDTQRFLRRTAVLDQLCAPLCDAILESSSAAGHLRRLEASSLFLVPLDRQRSWYRYHALFREFLTGELRRTEPDLIVTLHRRAAAWFEANGTPSQALEHLLQTGDWERSVQLVSKLSLPTFHAGRLSTVQRWYAAIGDANIERYPPLAVLAGWESVLIGDTTRAERRAAFLDAASFDLTPADGSASFASARAMLRAAMCASGPERMMEDAAFGLAQEPAWSPWRDQALWLMGEAHLLTGHLDEASALLTEASASAAAMGNSDTIPICEAHLAWLVMDHGEWQEANDRLELALATIEQNRLQDYVFSIPTFGGAARLALHRGDTSEAHRQLARAMRVRPTATYVLPYHAVRARLQLAEVHLALADLATSRQLLREIHDILAHRPDLGILVDEVEKFRQVLASSTSTGAVRRPPLTPAELRLLPYLQTHLTVEHIAERLFLSSHTVRTQVKSIYRKLGVSSRDDAIQEATTIGLLGA